MISNMSGLLRIEKRGGRRMGSGRKRTGRQSIMIRLAPRTVEWLDQRSPTPRGHIVDELVSLAEQALS